MVCKRLALLLSLLFRPFYILISSSRVLEFFLSYQSSLSSASIADTSSCVTVTSYISNSVSFDITSRCARYFSTSNALFLLKSASSLYRLCFVMSYLLLKNGRTPRSCKIHFSPSMTASSSLLISSLPHCQVMNSRKRQPQRKIFVAAVLIGGLKQKNPRLYQGNKNFSIA